MRHALAGHDTPYPVWAVCLDMAKGDPLRAREIFENIDQLWFEYWAHWHTEHEHAEAKRPK